MFASSLMMSTTELSYLEILLFTILGGLFSFNLFFFSSSYLMHRFRTRNRSKNSVIRKKKNFTKMNKTIVRYKSSPYAMWLICVLAPLFMSVPLGSIVVAKFYRHNNKAYFIVTSTLIIAAIILTSLSYLVFKIVLF